MPNIGCTNMNLGYLQDVAITALSTQNLNNAAYYYAVSFSVSENKTLNTVRQRCTNVVGTVASTDIVVTLHPPDASNDCDEGTVLDTSTNSTMSGTGAQTVTWSGFTYNLVAGTRYFLMWKNTNGTPASNYASIMITLANSNCSTIASASLDWGFVRQSSVNSGTSWTTVSNTLPIFRLGFSDSTFQGFPLIATNQSSVSEGVYAAREAGVYFKMWDNASVNVTHVCAVISKTGTPTEALSVKIYEGTTLIATSTQSVTAGIVTTGAVIYSLMFTTPVKLKAATYYRVVFAEAAQSDASTNRYNILYGSFDTDANSASLVPMNGTWVHTYYNAGWTETANYVPQIQIAGYYDTPLANVTRGFGGV